MSISVGRGEPGWVHSELAKAYKEANDVYIVLQFHAWKQTVSGGSAHEGPGTTSVLFMCCLNHAP